MPDRNPSGGDDDQLRALAQKLGLPADDPKVLQDLRAMAQDATSDRPAETHPRASNRPAAPVPAGPSIPPQARIVIGAIIGVLVFLYLSGRLDSTLYPIGLNLNECGKNAYGAVYCGDELTEYRNNVEQPLNEAQNEIQGSLRELE